MQQPDADAPLCLSQQANRCRLWHLCADRRKRITVVLLHCDQVRWVNATTKFAAQSHGDCPLQIRSVAGKQLLKSRLGAAAYLLEQTPGCLLVRCDGAHTRLLASFLSSYLRRILIIDRLEHVAFSLSISTGLKVVATFVWFQGSQRVGN